MIYVSQLTSLTPKTPCKIDVQQVNWGLSFRNMFQFGLIENNYGTEGGMSPTAPSSSSGSGGLDTYCNWRNRLQERCIAESRDDE